MHATHRVPAGFFMSIRNWQFVIICRIFKGCCHDFCENSTVRSSFSEIV